MIAVDTSALVAIVLGEAGGRDCVDALNAEPHVLMSAGTVVETLIVSARRNVTAQMVGLIEGIGPEIVAVTEASAKRMALAYDRWGKGVHPASLNLGDCFAYEVAKSNSCPLLFIGDDFSRTDLESVLPNPSNSRPRR